MKQPALLTASGHQGESSNVSEYIWETFDNLFKTVHRQGRRVEELETRVADLERHLQARVQERPTAQQQPKSVEQVITEMPAERAA
jgi:hypothetical protein